VLFVSPAANGLAVLVNLCRLQQGLELNASPVLGHLKLLSLELKVFPDVLFVLDIFHGAESVLKECLLSVDLGDQLLLKSVKAIVGGSTKGRFAMLILLRHPREGLKRMLLVDVRI
jgi:hypothetical protein